MFDIVRKGLPFLVASGLCTPFLAVAIGYLAVLLLGHSCPEPLARALLYCLYWLTGWPVIFVPVLALVCASIAAAWWQKSKTLFELAATAVYSVVLLLYIGYLIWWYATGQAFEL